MAVKFLGRDADNRVQDAIYLYGLSDDAGIGIESRFPEVVIHYCARLGLGRIVARIKTGPACESYAKCAEVIRCDVERCDLCRSFLIWNWIAVFAFVLRPAGDVETGVGVAQRF